MADEIDQFLKRAARRRKQAVGKAQKPAPRRPEYTERARERQVIDVEPIEEAELAEDDEEIIVAEVIARPGDREGSGPRGTSPVSRSHSDADPLVEKIRQQLSQPGGLAQAFVLQEILQRPEHRWS